MISPERPSAPPARPARARAVAAPAPASRTLAAVVALLLALAVVLLGAGRADAHNALLGTDPADGSTVDAPPAQITLTFDQPAQALGTEIVVLGPDGATVSTGDAQLVDDTVTQALAADLPAGAYSVEWRVTSADGHPLSGSLAFTASAGAEAAEPAAPTAPETIEPTAEPTTTTQAEPTAEADETLAPAQELAEDEDAGIAAGLVAAIVVAVLAAAAIAVFVVRERRRNRGDSAGAGPAGGDGRAEG
ncbi:copper resistance CopC family protein [Cellulomonas pakistanensis]|uniref:CopC domain-containing protein n=1 Tax=Cellulomonas pakistanensis TaxID=992287 RepID=A0A919U523_9CELL|nr:copper resistance CopC family protein [Cellulomonas pakistanensis]GIG38096.1 hypothetical protein Cpa01nite_34770 [Cellulomonas pakistanensis]